MNARLEYEQRLWQQGYSRVMGLDEVGRGCLSGPVAAAGVIFESGTDIEGIRDSKNLEEGERKRLAGLIKQRALFWTVEYCSVDEIDKLNILWASLKAMQKCVDAAREKPDYLLVDGNRYGSSLIPYTCLVKGDDRSVSIGAASILAKVHRDELMKRLHQDFPYYGWKTNVGYPTVQHYEGLQAYGITQYHRRSFNLKTDKEYREKDQ
ncbi:ribonuclease HII [Halalkalibaculum sp. DA3122]|uniref:ribonuclease HII n=1 Tax=Halalkalibaculum sp. DA3122 TaxID=3373607 RepID=UPI00375540E6